MGTLAVLEGSNSRPEFEEIRKTYGQMDAEAIKVCLKATMANHYIKPF